MKQYSPNKLYDNRYFVTFDEAGVFRTRIGHRLCGTEKPESICKENGGEMNGGRCGTTKEEICHSLTL